MFKKDRDSSRDSQDCERTPETVTGLKKKSLQPWSSLKLPFLERHDVARERLLRFLIYGPRGSQWTPKQCCF